MITHLFCISLTNSGHMPILKPIVLKGIGCHWLVQIRVHIHWFRQVGIYLLGQVT